MEQINCPLCGSDNKTLFHRISRDIHPDNVICNSCSMIFVSPRVPEREYIKYYIAGYAKEVYKTGGDAERRQIIEWRASSSRKKINFFPDVYKIGAKVFEVGAGTGTFLNELHTKYKCQVTGVEPSKELRAIATQEFGLNIVPGTLDEYMLDKKKVDVFDIIIMDQVLEHLYRPVHALSLCKKLLGSDGIIYIGVPNASNPAHPINEFFIPEHISTFTPWTVMLMLWRAGFKIVRLVTPDKSPLHLIATHTENTALEQLPMFQVFKPLTAKQIKLCFFS